MSITRRIYVSLPSDQGLPTRLNDLKWALVDAIETLGYTPEVFTNPAGITGFAASRPWGEQDADAVARRCSGAAVIGMARRTFRGIGSRPVRLATPPAPGAGLLPLKLGLPTLVVAHRNLARHVAAAPSFDGCLGEIPPGADTDWLRTEDFRVPFEDWRLRLGRRRDVLLAYSRASLETAARLKECLLRLGATVLDWQADPLAGTSSVARIEEAARRCTAGIFLFGGADGPGDGVAFEAGYFLGVKGRGNLLLIREPDSNVPADLAGGGHFLLQDPSDPGPIESLVEAFAAAL
jgi:hypothetical protein